MTSLSDKSQLTSASIEITGVRRIGESVPRKEDDRFVRGRGQYSDDINKPGQCYAAFVRSTHAHGRIRSINTEAARQTKDVITILTGKDYVGDGHGPVVHRAIEGDPLDYRTPAFGSEDPAAIQIDQWLLPFDKVRHVGEPVAMVIAATRAIAETAAELVEVDIEILPAVTDVIQAASSDALTIHDQAPGNLCIHQIRGDTEKTSATLSESDVVVTGKFNVPRITGAQMEPRSGIGEYDPEQDQFIVTAGCQGVHRYRDMIASALRTDKDGVRVICPDVGGGFGPRGHVNPEFVTLAWAAKRLLRPVKWTSTRSEAFVSDWQGRDMVLEGKLGVMADGRINAYQLRVLANNGAHTICYAPVANLSRFITTVYDIAMASLDLRVYLTNTVPVLPYRAAGRPETHYAIERLIDLAAVKIGLDRLEMRRQNLIDREKMPYKTAMGMTYDVCAFEEALDTAEELCNWQDFDARRAESEKNANLRGIAIVPFVETPVGAPFEMARLDIRPGGDTVIYAGTQNHGQGHETTYSQIVSDLLGIPFEKISLAGGDTEELPIGGGTHSDRSMRMLGTLLYNISQDIIEQARPVAAHLLQAREEDIVYSDHKFHIEDTGQEATILDVADAFKEFHGGSQILTSTSDLQGRIRAFPYGAAAAEVEIDPGTGEVTVANFCIVDDCGTPVNPMVVEGQVHGGIVQGVGQTIGECYAYESSTGQILSGSFMDYMMPRADQFPSFKVVSVETETEGNPLGIKAGGEAGTVPALAVIANAVLDALSTKDVQHLDMPFTAPNIWKALQQGQ
ncbi:MAG: xanthine dehydrogenase family protein molybdopterin-binding subunit [Methyloligellaceae bacterium]